MKDDLDTRPLFKLKAIATERNLQFDADTITKIELLNMLAVSRSAGGDKNGGTIVTSAPDADDESTDTDNLASEVIRLAKLSPLEYDKVRKDEAKVLGVRPGTLDASIKSARKEEVNNLPFEDVEPWHESVDGSALLATIAATIKRFIICEPHTETAAALWITMCWFMDVVQVAPLAVITAPEKRCGKSLLLFLLGRLVPRPLMSSNISPSALFRSIHLWQPTLLIDETDACLKDNEELRGLINCGHTRDSAFTIRCVGDDHTPNKFNVWGAKALAGIGQVADTLMDRSIILELRRKLPHESVERIRHAEPTLFRDISSKLARFANDNRDCVRLARPDLPSSLHDRAQDNWEPLLCIATVAGGEWYRTGVAAALKISGNADQSLTIGAELLLDIQAAFIRKKVDRIGSADLIFELCSDDESPWATYNRSYPNAIKPRQLANKLKGYGIHSKTMRIGMNNVKGYELNQFTEAFSRYVPSPSVSVTTSQHLPIVESQTFANGTYPTQELLYPSHETITVNDTSEHLLCIEPSRYVYVTDTKTHEPLPIQACNVVTDRITKPTSYNIRRPAFICHACGSTTFSINKDSVKICGDCNVSEVQA